MHNKKVKFKNNIIEFFKTYPEDTTALLVNGTMFQEKHRVYAVKHGKNLGVEPVEVFRSDVAELIKPLIVKNEKESQKETISIHTKASLNALNKPKVVEIGVELGLEMPTRATKDDWIEAILNISKKNDDDSKPGEDEDKDESEAEKDLEKEDVKTKDN